MTKKRIIIGILIILLLLAGIAVNIIAMEQRKDLESKINSTNIAENVDNEVQLNKVKDNKTTVEEDDLVLRGDEYKVAKVKDKDGNTISLDREENKPMILLFWNNTEESGIEAANILQSYYSKYNNKITFALVSVVEDDGIEEMEKIIEENNIEIKNVYDMVDRSASKANNISEIPTLAAIDKKGEIINKLSNNLNEDVIEANLDVISENF